MLAPPAEARREERGRTERRRKGAAAQNRSCARVSARVPAPREGRVSDTEGKVFIASRYRARAGEAAQRQPVPQPFTSRPLRPRCRALRSSAPRLVG